MKISEIQSNIVDKFFGAAFKKHDDNISSLLKSASLDNLIQARRALSEDDVDLIFQSCTAKDTLSAKFNPRESKGVFMRLKTVSLNSDFI
jgi:hypothetical protein